MLYWKNRSVSKSVMSAKFATVIGLAIEQYIIGSE